MRTRFSFSVEGGECCKGADEDAQVGNRNQEAEPVDHVDRFYREQVEIFDWETSVSIRCDRYFIFIFRLL